MLKVLAPVAAFKRPFVCAFQTPPVDTGVLTAFTGARTDGHSGKISLSLSLTLSLYLSLSLSSLFPSSLFSFVSLFHLVFSLFLHPVFSALIFNLLFFSSLSFSSSLSIRTSPIVLACVCVFCVSWCCVCVLCFVLMCVVVCAFVCVGREGCFEHVLVCKFKTTYV